MRYKENLKVEDLLKKFGYSYETAVVKRNKRINTEEEIIDDNDKITIIPIVSGG
ncbi:MAG: MoaD/ThiS family protein [Euryarchaeota archaeon]|nr:MoaD/ThiS family protein [Euryarchaeota archaeon]